MTLGHPLHGRSQPPPPAYVAPTYASTWDTPKIPFSGMMQPMYPGSDQAGYV
jgi:hypothetical protein